MNSKVCRKCGAELVAEAAYCHVCGAAQTRQRTQRAKTRGNGQGTVFKRGKRWVALVTVTYIRDGLNEPKRQTHSRTFDKKSEALAALPELQKEGRELILGVRYGTSITFKALYDAWLPTHRAGKDTMNCYRAAIKYLKPVWALRMDEITIDDLQGCMDECPRGKRTRENMKATVGLMYKYGIPRNLIPQDRNLAQFMIVEGSGAAARESFTPQQIERIRKQIGKTPYADQVYALIYLGFRPSEFLALTSANYNRELEYFVGGAKTAAGIDRLVTISPKISAIVKSAAMQGGKTIFCRADGTPWTRNSFTDAFYAVLDAAGIDNPMIEIAPGIQRHKYTPHSCRHTFATLMKRVDGSSKDKQSLIGHASEEQLKYYQDAPISDLRRITDAI